MSMLQLLKVQFLKSLPADQGQGLHRDWQTGRFWLLTRLAPLWVCWWIVEEQRESLWIWTQLAPLRGGQYKLCLDLRINMRRVDLEDLLRTRELEDWDSVVLREPAESESEWAKRAAKDASRAAPSHRPFPSGPRNWAALCMQVEKPSWKECFWPPPPALVSSPLAVFCRKRTVCSSISAFSTLRWVSSWDRNKDLIHSQHPQKGL